MKKPNRLINEKSPYLMQHAYNPVDWYPWSEEAFLKAQELDKPVFLSIGYSTCHWCHVMEKESFEDEEVAELMNDIFISIKVDREERPDIDNVYMSVCQMLTGGGGWPMTIFMTPDKKPFFAGTYFPKENRFGKPGLKIILPQIKELWNNKRDELLNVSERISSALASHFEKSFPLTQDIFKIAFKEFEERFDNEYGGFGTAPKFPSPHNLMFLLRYYKTEKKALEMVEKTLSGMRAGGIYDHIGFGFCRYSTDKEWLIPHFEKMLYDQALISIAYIEAYQVTQKEIYKNTAEEILNYVLRDMRHPDGAFYSAEDADSEGIEGKFYLWTAEEIREILGEDAELIIKYFNVKDDGNFYEADSLMPGANILHLKMNIKDFALEMGVPEEQLKVRIETARKKLFEVREKRIHPFKDDKVLTDWNALMISSLAKASQVFDNDEYLYSAFKAADFILSKMINKDGKLLHLYKDNEASVFGFADDYAFTIQALLDLYEASFKIKYLKEAIKLNEDFIKHFRDDENGGFFFTPDYGEKLLVRQKEIYDGAVPSANSVAMLNLLRIGRITSESRYEDLAESINRIFSSQVSRYPAGYTQFLNALHFASGSKEIIISGEDDGFTKYIFKKFLPAKIILKVSSPDDEILSIAPYLRNYLPSVKKTKVYVCENYSCQLPAESIETLEQILL